MKLGTVILLSALVAAPACGGGGGSSPTVPTLAATFAPDSQPTPPLPKTAAMAQGPKANDVVTVDVTLTGANGVTAVTFEVLYDATHTEYVGFTNGSALEQGASQPIIYQALPPSSPGHLFVTVARTGADGSTNVAGTMTVVGLQFRVKQAGVYPLNLQNEVVYDGQSTPQPIPGITWYAGAVTGA